MKKIIVDKEGGKFSYQNLTYSASLQCFTVIETNQNTHIIRNAGEVNRILDINNTSYFVYGIYASGLLPNP